MIKITNELGLPLPLVTWLLNDDYDYNPDPLVVSATSLIKPTKKTVLSNAVTRSEHIQVHIDVKDKLASIRGQNLHAAIEDSYKDVTKVKGLSEMLGMDVPEVRMEERLHADIEVDGVTYTVSGKFDAIIDSIVTDWKTESTYSFNDPVKHRDRKIQLSIYAWLCVKNDIPVNTKVGHYFSIYQNWMKGFAAKSDSDKYPDAPIKRFETELVTGKQLEFWIKDKIRERNALSLEDANEITCTPDELWMGDATYQYFSKPDAKRASRNFTDMGEAQAHLASKNGVGLIKEKPRFAKACEYCFGSAVCNQYQTLLSNGQIDNESNAISLSPSFGE